MSRPFSPLPPLHDGYLDGVLTRDDEARLFVRTAQGSQFTLILSGVSRFKVDGFSEGNIIFECELSTDPEITKDVLIDLNHGSTNDRELARLRERVSNEGYRVFWIAPSYGATVAALIEGLSVVDGVVTR
ncbi:hypothetical protein [Luteibacter sp. UNC138MFCol5.1]|uniref:hypothetical protein n=1 Tax=Luteibacter sp. UNC138MFCol5.1 TaxID=1502774 RepID=UPI000B7CC147|nr:hypothetical protein [Luteibacter sp. UNC138MFCol5.1]